MVQFRVRAGQPTSAGFLVLAIVKRKDLLAGLLGVAFCLGRRKPVCVWISASKMLGLAKRCAKRCGLPPAHLGNLGTRSIHPNGPIKQFPVPKGKFDILFWGRDEFSCIALQRLYEASERAGRKPPLIE